jgi:DHA3 family macrolide efflux protein-like MFS transporter
MTDEVPSSPTPEIETRWVPKFFTIWVGQAFSLVGSALVQFALVWWLTSQTGSATVLAGSTLVALLPQIFLAPFVGALVDRWNRRLIMIVADSAIAAATAVLIVLFLAGNVQVWQVYVILFIRSLGGAFHGPAMAASTSLMVPNKHLARISGLNQTMQGVISIFAPPLGALLLGLMPTPGVLAIDIVTAALAVIPLLFVAIPNPPRQEAPVGAVRPSYWDDLRQGFGYVAKWPGLLGLILLAMLLNFLLVPASSLMPLLVKQELGGGAPQLALAETVFGVGVIVAGIILGAWGGFRRRIFTSLAGVVGIGLGVILSGLTPPQAFYVLLIANFILGATQVFANGPLTAIFQSAVQPDMQGRVFSLIGAGATAMMPLSLLVAGPLSDALGVRTWYWFGGSACIFFALLAFFIPAIVNIEKNNQVQPSKENHI